MTWLQDLEPFIRDEASFIVSEFAKRGVDIEGVPTREGGVAFMYRSGQLLAREQYLGPIRDVLGRRGQVVVNKRVIKDIVLVDMLPPGEKGDRSAEASEGNGGNAESNSLPSEGRGELPALLDFLDEVDAAIGPGIVTPNQVVTVAGGQPSPCPATEPQEIYDPAPHPPVCRSGGARVRIYVADTGIVASTVANCTWLDGVTGDDDPQVAGTTIEPYGAHGTFVAGVIRALAPEAEIDVRNVFDTAGSALESEFVPDLNAGFGYGAEIFHLTVASPTRSNFPLLAFEAWLELMHTYKGVVCVVAAGNSSSREPYWPAAFPGTISVGALSADCRHRAYFTNYGGWVDVYAPGENLVNAFATGSYKCHVDPYTGETRRFSGMAQWSGTSFSSPIVTGLIAARMARCGESARDAAAALLAEARAQTIPGVGAVLFPGCCDGDDEHGRSGSGWDHGPHGGDGGRCGCGHGGCGHGRCGCGGDRGCRCGGDCGCGRHGQHGRMSR